MFDFEDSGQTQDNVVWNMPEVLISSCVDRYGTRATMSRTHQAVAAA